MADIEKNELAGNGCREGDETPLLGGDDYRKEWTANPQRLLARKPYLGRAIGCFLMALSTIVLFLPWPISQAIKTLPDWSTMDNQSSWVEKVNENEHGSMPDVMAALTRRNLAARQECIKAENCAANQEDIIVVQNWEHRRVITGHKFAGGEVTFARSSQAALEALNYTLVYHGESIPELSKVIDEQYGGWPNVRFVFVDPNEIRQCEDLSKNCYSSPENPNGVPVWKVLVESFWADDIHPLGGNWVFTPEDYSWGSSQTKFLGYSIEDSCTNTSYIEPRLRFGSRTLQYALGRKNLFAWFKTILVQTWRRNQKTVFVLGKKLDYFVKEEHPWNLTHYQAASDKLLVKFELGYENVSLQEKERFAEPVDWVIADSMFQNHGLIRPQFFTQLLSTASVVLGLGHPMSSPTPYQALCMGVPFINPIKSRDSKYPNDRTKWETQHDGLRFIPEPYVYHVYKGDTDGFVRAIDSAIKNPIERYIPAERTQTQVTHRMRKLLHRDYQGLARNILKERQAGKGGIVYNI